MWRNIRKGSTHFSSAVLTGRDAEGYPFSVRCTPVFDDERQIISITPATGAMMTQGQSGLLFHKHNEQLWDLEMFLVLGKLEFAEGGWIFTPERVIGEVGQKPWQLLMTIVGMRRTARQYLAKRGLARPRIPWERIKSFYPTKTSTAQTPQLPTQAKQG